MKRMAVFALAALVGMGLVSQAYATTYYVATNGLDTNPGTLASPYKTIQKGLDVAVAGDTVHVKPGNFRERITFPRSGTVSQPITLEGEAGAVLDSSDAFTPNWVMEASGFEGYDVYSTYLPEFEPRYVAINDQSVVMLDYASHINSLDMWYWAKVIKHGVTDEELWYKTGNGYDGVRALGMYHTGSKKLYLKIKPQGNAFPGINPSTVTVKITKKDTCAITINGASYVTVRGLQIKYGVYAARVDNSTGAIFEYNDILPANHGVRLGDGAANFTFRYNEYSMEQYADTSNWDYGSDVWMAHKSGGFIDKWAVEARNSVGGHHIYNNYFHDGFDGVSTGWNGNPAAESPYNANIEVDHNVFADLIDDAMDPARNCTNHKWHDNVTVNCQQGMRIRNIFFGPFYIYNNIFIAGPLTMQDIMLFGSSEGQSPQVYFYNNTVDESMDTASERGAYTLNNFAPGSPGTYHFYNNLFYGDQWVKLISSAAPTWDGNGNVYARRTGAWDVTYNQAYAQNLGIDVNSDWVTTGPGFVDYPMYNLALTSTSPARQTGIDLYTRFGVALPGGYGPGYYSGSAPDVGALAYGVPMPPLPFSATPPPPPPPGGYAFNIASGLNHSVALKNDGTIWAWGRNSGKQLGDNTQTDRKNPVEVLGIGGAGFLTGMSDVGSGSIHTIAARSDGTVYAWGTNANGQLGNNSLTNSAVPVQVLGVGGSGFLTDVTAVSGSLASSIALKSDGTVWTWGKNSTGQLGNNSVTQIKTPVQVVGVGGTGFLTGIIAIAGGAEAQHFLALKSDGTVYAWGYNAKGQLGDASTTNRTTPVQVKGIGGTGTLANVVGIALATNHSLAVRSDGTVVAWGENVNGQVGDNTTTNRTSPVQVLGVGGSGFLTGAVAVACGTSHSAAVKSDGSVWTWGLNNQGQLGNNSLTQSKTPVQVLGVGGSGLLTGMVSVSAGDRHTLVMKADGAMYDWGVNTFGQLGNGTNTQSLVPVGVIF